MNTYQHGMLSLFVATGEVNGLDDDPPDLGKYSDDSIPQPDPIRDFLEKVKLDGSAADPDWDQLIDHSAPLQKRANSVDADLSKRSSSPYKIRLEKTVIDGETWIFGYDHEGANVYTNILAEGEEEE